VEASNSCAGTLIFGCFFFIVFCQSFFSFFSPIFAFFLLSILLSFLLLSNWFLFLSSFVFPLLFRHCFIPVSLDHVVSSLAYPNLLGTKRLGCCCMLCNGNLFSAENPDSDYLHLRKTHAPNALTRLGFLGRTLQRNLHVGVSFVKYESCFHSKANKIQPVHRHMM
jgi:hypothetical protein